LMACLPATVGGPHGLPRLANLLVAQLPHFMQIKSPWGKFLYIYTYLNTVYLFLSTFYFF